MVPLKQVTYQSTDLLTVTNFCFLDLFLDLFLDRLLSIARFRRASSKRIISSLTLISL